MNNLNEKNENYAKLHAPDNNSIYIFTIFSSKGSAHTQITYMRHKRALDICNFSVFFTEKM